ncbi:glycosyltransferase [Rothia terrae]|uniref:glycosyltransferase n=1 Tax=Rothia terrae TaxID=396015 RepID=UPI0033F14C50
MKTRNLHLISMHTSPLSQPGNRDAGGMNVYIVSLVKAMLAADENLHIEVFTLSTEFGAIYERTDLSKRCSVHTLAFERAEGAVKEDLPQLIPEFVEHMRRYAVNTPDIVHSHYWLSGLAALQYAPEDVPIVHTMHTTGAVKNDKACAGEPLEPQQRIDGERRIVDACDALVVNTMHELEQMVRFYSADASNLHIIRPGVDTEIFYPAVKTNFSDAAGEILFAGRPQPLKGPHILVEALALLPRELNVSLTMVGTSANDYEHRLVARAKALGLGNKVRIVPALPAPELARAMQQADIVACPSSSETFGLVALEAQATGTAVIATRVDGLQDAVADAESGLLVDSRDPSAWAAALEYLIRNPDIRQKLGRAGAQRAQTMDWASAASTTLELYSSLTKEK